ncbi:GNAT family N-acetyltransferase [Dyadobacter sp. NIV53]|uniref:GNAT family N-acetyltransferase n=1 Tax=Dyadobacter sp. NIV53 TaxID=2861765 RepID=UPI001C889E2A|nr:GNAT family N-acetyltransferase [Dyadobacter sp. NIV53]
MTPVLLTRSQINDRQWDELITCSRQSIIYGFSWYLDIVCEEWNAIVWPADDDFQIVMPLPIRNKCYINVIQQPFFCQYLGIFSRNELTEQQTIDFLTILSSHFSYISTYSFHPHNHSVILAVLPKFPALNFKLNHTYWLSLNNSIEVIQNGYNTDRKSNLRKAGEFIWTMERSEDLLPLIELFEKHHAHRIRSGVSSQAYQILTVLTQKLISKNYAEIWYAVSDGVIHAGALFVKRGSKAVYLFNAADEIGRKGNGRTYLLNKFFERNAGSNMHFDFESPEIDSVSDFYKSFGGETKPFFEIQKNDLPFPLKQIQHFRKNLLLKTR